MNVRKVEEYLRVLEGMVLDEEKIVTFKLLSRTLEINVNTAKQLLHMYLVKQQKISPCTVSATHLLAGLSRDGTFLVSIISDEKLDEAKKKYDKITSEHVYSVQKGKASALEKNSQILFVADLTLPPAKSYPIRYHKVLEEKTNDEPKNNKGEILKVKTEPKCDVKVEEKKWTKQSPQKEEKQTGKKSRSISDFFNSQSQRKNVDKEEKQKKSEVKSDHEEKVENVSKNVKSETRKMLSDESPKTKKSDENPSRSDKPKEDKKKKKEKEKREVKKRKRIVSASEESESDEEERDALLCAEPAISDTTERLKINDDDDEDGHFENKKRRKKLVDKTVLLDDGFMETYKEVVYETDSDGESAKHGEKEKEAKMSFQSEGNVEKGKTKEKSESKKMKFSAQKNNSKKQSTILSFFKKS